MDTVTPIPFFKGFRQWLGTFILPAMASAAILWAFSVTTGTVTPMVIACTALAMCLIMAWHTLKICAMDRALAAPENFNRNDPEMEELRKDVQDMCQKAKAVNHGTRLFTVNDSRIVAMAAWTPWSGHLIGISDGTMKRAKPEHVRAILAHEIGHIANNDPKKLHRRIHLCNFIAVTALICAIAATLGMPLIAKAGALLAYLALDLLSNLGRNAMARIAEIRADHKAGLLAGKQAAAEALAFVRECMEEDGLREAHGMFHPHPSMTDRIALLMAK